MDNPPPDGIHAMVPQDSMSEGARKLRQVYAITPGLPLPRGGDGFMWQYLGKDSWYQEGMPRDVPEAEIFLWDADPGGYDISELGWVEPAYLPAWEETILEDRGSHELVQDTAGRHVLYFKGPRWGYMPTYVGHPVKDHRTWEEHARWRLDPNSLARYSNLQERLAPAKDAAAKGLIINEMVIGGYMYLRVLIGPEDLLYAFHDQPTLIHECMKAWLELADAVIASHQQHITLDQLSLAEDICYKNGPLISPDMMREFLFPYYQQLISNAKLRQLDPTRHLFFCVDTDGHAPAVIPLYQELGLDVMWPFEVAAGCDVVAIGRQHPRLAMIGGIDKRVLAKGKLAIDEHLAYIIPAMRARGGYIPGCDHAVPEEVSYENYLYYRKRCVELGS